MAAKDKGICDTYEAEALRLGWKPYGDGSWKRGRGRNYERKLSAEAAVESEGAGMSDRPPRQIIGDDAYMQLVFEGYEVIPADTLASKDTALAEIRAENERLRAALALSDQPCAYCSLPADEWNRCQHGFPGCGRSDDAMGCPELGASLRAIAAQEEIERLRKANRELHRRVQIAEAIHQSVISMSESWGRPSKSQDEWSRGWNAGCLSFGRVVKFRLRRLRALASQPMPELGGGR